MGVRALLPPRDVEIAAKDMLLWCAPRTHMAPWISALAATKTTPGPR